MAMNMINPLQGLQGHQNYHQGLGAMGATQSMAPSFAEAPISAMGTLKERWRTLQRHVGNLARENEQYEAAVVNSREALRKAQLVQTEFEAELETLGFIKTSKALGVEPTWFNVADSIRRA